MFITRVLASFPFAKSSCLKPTSSQVLFKNNFPNELRDSNI